MISNTGDWWTLAWVQIWQIGLLALFVGAVGFAVGRRWPHLAYALWLLVLLKCFVPPMGSWPVNALGWLTPTSGMRSGNVDAVEADEAPRVLGNAVQASASNQATSQPSPTAMPIVPAHERAIDTSVRSNDFSRLAIQSVPLVWLSGTVLLCGVAIGRGSEIGRRLRRTSHVVSDELLDTVERLTKRLGMRREARVFATTADVGPMVAGLWRPTVYVPEMLLQQLSRPQLEAMLLHELAHVRRRDVWVAAVQFAAQAVWWFHPVVWWMNRQITRERERCCDEEVVANLSGKRTEYARLLVMVLEVRHRLEPLWGYPAVRPVELTRRRLEEIMKRKSRVHARAPRWCWIVAALCGFVALPSAVPPADAETTANSSAVKVAQNTPRATESAPSRKRPPALLSYGDGKADGKKSYGGSGHMIRFELPEGVTKVRGLRIYGSRYGLPQAPNEDFEITFLSDDLEETLDSQAAAYRLFKRGKQSWVRVLFDKEVELPKAFWVALNFNAHQTKGVYLSYDTSTKGEHSRAGLPGDEEPPKETDFGGDWMVQVMLSRPE